MPERIEMRRPTSDGTRYRLRSSKGTGSRPTTPEVGPMDAQRMPSANVTMGLDVGDQRSSWCVVDGVGRVLERGEVRTVGTALRRLFERRPPSRVVAGGGNAFAVGEPG